MNGGVAFPSLHPHRGGITAVFLHHNGAWGGELGGKLTHRDGECPIRTFDSRVNTSLAESHFFCIHNSEGTGACVRMTLGNW